MWSIHFRGLASTARIAFSRGLSRILNAPVPIATGLAIPLGTILPAFLIALVSRIFKLHNHLSNILGIRHRFDLEAILFPLAIATSIAFPVEKVRQIKKQRKDLMYKTFYKYASSSPSKAVMKRTTSPWLWINSLGIG